MPSSTSTSIIILPSIIALATLAASDGRLLQQQQQQQQMPMGSGSDANDGTNANDTEGTAPTTMGDMANMGSMEDTSDMGNMDEGHDMTAAAGDHNNVIVGAFSGCGPHINLASSKRYARVNLAMHSGMAINFTGNAEYDFLAGMIPHHSAAVDMCDVYRRAVAAAAGANNSTTTTSSNNSMTTTNEINPGIESLCYNITYGPISWGEWQYDFSQPGENEQMLDVIQSLDMLQHYEEGCSALGGDEKEDLAGLIAALAAAGAGGQDTDKDDGAATDAGMDKVEMEINIEMEMGGDMDREEITSSSANMSVSNMGGQHGGHRHHQDMFMGCGNLDHPQTLDYYKVNMDMHMRMAFQWTGNPDVDFLLGMIPHHEGAIAMCDVYYKYWSCAPSRTVCVDPLPLSVVQRLMSDGEAVDILNAMHHVCTGHIMATQPKEVEWMKKELGRIDPDALEMYETMMEEEAYPCQSGESGETHNEGDMNMDHSSGMHGSGDNIGMKDPNGGDDMGMETAMKNGRNGSDTNSSDGGYLAVWPTQILLGSVAAFVVTYLGC